MEYLRKALWGSSSTTDDSADSNSNTVAAADKEKEKEGGDGKGSDEVQAPPAAPPDGSFGSVLWSVLSSKMGSDVVSSGISLPAWMYEPLTILQRCSECLEHHDLLDVAAQQTDPAARLAHVVAFAVSAYGSTNDARTKTNFNPILGETYEFIDPTHGWRLFGEQVSHHPPVSALHVIGPIDSATKQPRWHLWQNSSPTTKFLGNSLDINTRGRTHIYFTRTEEHVSFTNPWTRVHNIILGRMWYEHYGELNMVLKDVRSGTVLCTASVSFKKAGLFQGAQHDVDGVIRRFDPLLKDKDKGEEKKDKEKDKDKGEKTIRVSGAWDAQVTLEWLRDCGDAHKGDKREVFRLPQPPVWTEPYGMSQFASRLAVSDARMRRYLLPSDARRRPDRSMLERGQHDAATLWKKRLEEQQRQERKVREKKGEAWRPQWFAKVSECSAEQRAHWPVPAGAHDEDDVWVYVGDYWEQRDARLAQLDKDEKAATAHKGKGKGKGKNKSASGSATTTPRLTSSADAATQTLESDYYPADEDDGKAAPLRPRALKGTAADFMQHEIAIAREEGLKHAAAQDTEDELHTATTDSRRSTSEVTASRSEDRSGKSKEKDKEKRGKQKDKDAIRDNGGAQTLEVPRTVSTGSPKTLRKSRSKDKLTASDH